MIGADRVEVIDSRDLVGTRAGDQVDVPEDFVAAYRSTLPVIVTDWGTETRFGQASVLRAARVSSTLSVGVLIAGTPCRLTVHDTAARSFTDADADAVQLIGHILASAVERHQHERAQTAVADFGRFALQSRDLTATVARAVDVVAEVLDVPLGAVSRPAATAGQFALVHGRGPIGLPPARSTPSPPS